MVMRPNLVFWHVMQCYCRDEVSNGAVSMLLVAGMEDRQVLVSSGVLAHKVSLFHRGIRRLRHDQIGVVPVKVVT